MKHALSRICAMAMVLVMLVSLCACGPAATTTTTTAGGDTTTTLSDDVTTTVGDGETTTVGDDVTTTVGDGETTTVDDEVTTTVGDKVTTTVGDKATTTVDGGKATTTKAPTTKATTTKRGTTTTAKDPWVGDPWGNGGKPTKPATTTGKTEEQTYATLEKVERDPKYQNEAGINNLYKYYCYGTVFKPSELLPTFGYVKDGKVVDVMFEGCAVMPSPNVVYYGGLDTKESWDEWREHSYANVESINTTVASIQKTLNLKEYKVKVFLSLFNNNDDFGATRFNNWGELNGVKMTAKDKEERFQMIKYMIDSYAAEMKAKNYTNVEFVGFYWFDEYVRQEDLDWYNRVNDYVHSKGLITMISPYYKAGGWDLWDEAGFDLSSMQSNFFPTGQVGSLNGGTIRRIDGLAEAINSGKIGGAEIELFDQNKDDITGFKHIMKGLAESGAMNGYQLFYFGPRPLYTLSKSRDPYYRSSYDDMYKYIHNKLIPSEMEIHEFEKEQEYLPGATDWI